MISFPVIFVLFWYFDIVCTCTHAFQQLVEWYGLSRELKKIFGFMARARILPTVNRLCLSANINMDLVLLVNCSVILYRIVMNGSRREQHPSRYVFDEFYRFFFLFWKFNKIVLLVRKQKYLICMFGFDITCIYVYLPCMFRASSVTITNRCIPKLHVMSEFFKI